MWRYRGATGVAKKLRTGRPRLRSGVFPWGARGTADAANEAQLAMHPRAVKAAPCRMRGTPGAGDWTPAAAFQRQEGAAMRVPAPRAMARAAAQRLKAAAVAIAGEGGGGGRGRGANQNGESF